MKLFVTGGTGLIGRHLVEDRRARGDHLVVLTRDARRAEGSLDRGDDLELIQGDSAHPGSWQRRVDGCDAVVSLAGAGIADRRWSAAYKKVLADSRVETARRVVEAIGAASRRPAVLVNASAVGYYGDGGQRQLDEGAPAGEGFLGEVCRRWEGAALQAAEHGTRVAVMRFGVVLDRAGGAVAKMRTPFLLGLGGPLGSGRQYMPWIHWRDAVGLVDLVLRNPNASGPINTVAPEQVTNRQFAKALGRALRRPAILPMPRLALRLIMGEVAGALCASQRVVPAAAERFEYCFEHPELAGALAELMSKPEEARSSTRTATEGHGGTHR